MNIIHFIFIYYGNSEHICNGKNRYIIMIHFNYARVAEEEFAKYNSATGTSYPKEVEIKELDLFD